MHLIHIASDEKFIDSAYWQFNEAFPNQNYFYLLVKDPNVKLKYVTNIDHFQLIPKDLDKLKKLAANFSEDNIICFHGLDYYRSVFLNALPKKCKVVWFLWGMEVYNNKKVVDNSSVLGPLTSSLFLLDQSENKVFRYFKGIYGHLKYKFIYNTRIPQKEIINAMKRADYLSILYQEEFNFVSSLVNKDIHFLRFSYYPIELMVKDLDKRINDNHVLIGNSAFETNNHLEIFDILKNLNLNGKKLIVPLSYGDAAYREAIIEKGLALFGSNFQPLVDFMPLHQYNAYLEKCGIVIMNHYRQQAVGNVLTMLWMGAKVFLDERNTIYHYLKRIGIKVFSIQQELNRNHTHVFDLLTQEEQDAHRIILKKEIGKKPLLEALQSQFKAIQDVH